MTGVTAAELGIGELFWLIRDAGVVADVDTERIALWNRAAADMFGYSDEDAIGMPLTVLVPSELRARHQQAIAQYRVTGGGRLVDADAPVQVPAIRRDGRRIKVELRLSPLPSLVGTRYVLAILREVTERTAMEAALADANLTLRLTVEAEQQSGARLRRLLELKEELIHLLAHDVRTPLSAIHGFASLLRDADRLDAGQRADALDRIVASAERLDRLVGDVLDAAQLESGTLRYASRPFNLGAVLRAAAEELAAARGPGCYRLSLPPGLPAALGDPERHHQVAVNVFDNAAKFSAAGEVVEVSVSFDGATGLLTVAVADRGPGIAPGDQARVFRKFARLTPVGNGAAPGAGLGLFIARRLVMDQGGEISLDSRPGRGTTVRYSVPAAGGGTAAITPITPATT